MLPNFAVLVNAAFGAKFIELVFLAQWSSTHRLPKMPRSNLGVIVSILLTGAFVAVSFAEIDEDLSDIGGFYLDVSSHKEQGRDLVNPFKAFGVVIQAMLLKFLIKTILLARCKATSD